MDPPVIIHSPNCSCQFCSSELPSTHTCGSQDRTVPLHVEATAAGHMEVKNFSLQYVLLVAFVSILLGFSFCVYLKSMSNDEASDTTYYYQDLNSVEIKLGKNPLDPEVIKAVHSFQEFPYGNIPSIRREAEFDVQNDESSAVVLSGSNNNRRQVASTPCENNVLLKLWKDDLSFTIIAVTVLVGVMLARC
nr:triple gene block protein 3 [Potato mop-top virus]